MGNFACYSLTSCWRHLERVLDLASCLNIGGVYQSSGGQLAAYDSSKTVLKAFTVVNSVLTSAPSLHYLNEQLCFDLNCLLMLAKLAYTSVQRQSERQLLALSYSVSMLTGTFLGL